VAQQLRILQSLWAMEWRLANEPEWPLHTQLEKIRDAGYDGAGVRRWQDALVMKHMIRSLWERIVAENARDAA
jgi:hypothetical protein